MHELISYESQISLRELDFDLKIDLYTKSSSYTDECQINASHDIAATSSWLNQYTNSPKTYSSYKREAEKLLLWLSYIAGKSLKELKVEDMQSYINFLRSPPQSWCTARSNLNLGKWRPFIGKPALSTLKISIRSISSLFTYLVSANYLRFNPLKLIKTKDCFIHQEERKYQVWERMLANEEWQAVQNVLNNMSEESPKEQTHKMRSQFIFAMFYFLGLRINELATGTWNAFRQKDGSWWFFVRGKGGKLAHIPVNEQLLSFVKIYRLHLGKGPLPMPDEEEYFIISRKTGRGLEPRQIYSLVKEIGLEAAKAFPDDALKQEKLRKLSPHWLRHMFVSHQDQEGTPQTIIMLNSQHNSLATTKIYLHAEDALRQAEIQKLSMQLKPKTPVAKVVTPKTVNLQLNLKAGSICPATSLKGLIEIIEEHILKDIEYETNREYIKILQAQIVKNKKFGLDLKLEYKLHNVIEEDLVRIRREINKESELRLFKSTLSINQ